MTNVGRNIACLMLALCLGGGLPSVCFGQQTLPEALLSKGKLSDADQAQVNAFIELHRPNLSGDPEQIKAARGSLLRPLAGSVSTDFRVSYANALRPALEPLVTSPKEQVAINALRIMGEVATNASVPVLLKALDPATTVNTSVRYAACFGATKLFEVNARQARTVSGADLRSLVTVLAGAINSFPDPLVADESVRALALALDITDLKDDPAFKGDVVGQLAKAAGTRAQSIKDASTSQSLPSVIRAARALRDVITSDAGSAVAQIKDATYKESAGFAGDLAAAVLRLRAAGTGAFDGALIDQATGAAATIITLSYDRLSKGGNKADAPKNVEKNLQVLFGESGVLSKPPFGFAADRFK